MSSRLPAKIIYFLPMFLLAANISLFTLGTVASGTFLEECRSTATPYTFYDFCVYYIGGKIAASDEKQSLYKAEVQQRYLTSMRGTAPLSKETVVMQLAPFLPCLIMPFTLLPIDFAYAIYLCGSALAYFAGFFLLLKLRSKPVNPLIGALIAFCLLGTLPVFITTTLGQISHFVFFLASAYIFCLHRGKDRLAGILLALSSFKPHYALFLSIPALALKRWSVVITAILTEILLLTLSAGILGWQTVLAYPAAIISGGTAGSWREVAILMINLRGLLHAVGNSRLIFPISLIIMVLAMVALFLIWKKYNGTPTDYKKLWGLTIIIWLFCSAHTYIYDALLLLIAAVFLIAPEMPEGEVRNKSDLFRERMLLCTPYLQWLGMVVLPLNYHRSLPTSLILLTLCISIALDKKKSL